MLICFVALFLQLNNIQILKASSLANSPNNPRVLAVARDNPRGDILSADGEFTCGIDQLVNFLAGIADQPEILATDSVFIGARGDKNKSVTVRLTLSGVVPRKLVPEKKGLATF